MDIDSSLPNGGSSPFLRLKNSLRAVRDGVASSVGPLGAASNWRRQRLLILGFHGISRADEHHWDGWIYMPPPMFRRRLELIQQAGCHVLSYAQAVEKLRAGTLPPRAVTITFDDGFHDFASAAAPILEEFGYTATVFLSSYYAEFNRPIFDIALRYLLWKAEGISATHAGVAGQMHDFAFTHQLSGAEKDAQLAKLAGRLNIDYEAFCRSRLMQMMNAEEVRHVHALGHDIQMHTHRHRVSRRFELFAREIHDNREWIQKTIGVRPTHLSFPGGIWEPVERDWLLQLDTESAVTSSAALAHSRLDPLRLPRLIDNAFVSENAFRAWLSGTMELFPRGPQNRTQGQIFEESIRNADAESAVPLAGRL